MALPSVRVSVQVFAKNHLIWFCKLFTNITSILFSAQVILRVISTVIFTSKLFVWSFVYIVSVLSRWYNQCNADLLPCICLLWVILHHCWNIFNVFRARMCSWYSPKGVYGEILSLGTVLIRTLPGAGSVYSISPLLPVDTKKYIPTVRWILTVLKSMLPW